MQLVHDGQSFCYAPFDVPTAPTVPYQVWQKIIAKSASNIFTCKVVGVSATPYSTRASSAQYRTDQEWGSGSYGVMIDLGGPSDIVANLTAAQIMTAMENYVDARKAAGCKKYIACTVTPSTIYTGPQEIVRNALNVLMRANANNKFDAIADIAIHPRLQNASDTSLYSDGLHPTAAAASCMADLIADQVMLVTNGVTL